MNNAGLYFHYPCFDGLVSCILAWSFLERSEGWRVGEFRPVNYSIRDTWLSLKLKRPCAIVDFLYHPDAGFWADHHSTTFLSKEIEADFRRRRNTPFLVFDDRFGSCASLLFEKLEPMGVEKPHYREMVIWADKIDSAGYSSVEEAILGDAPALQINRTLLLDDGPEYADFLRQKLWEYDMDYVVRTPDVRSRHEEALRRVRTGLQRAGENMKVEGGTIARIDVENKQDEIISRYAPYYFVPDARYSIAIIRSGNKITITAMRNPWRPFESLPLGRMFEKFGGGGHERVGAVVIPAEQSERAQLVVQSVLAELQCQPANEKVIA